LQKWKRQQMITNKIIENKFYLYKKSAVKIKKIHKSSNRVVMKSIIDDSEHVIPFTGGELLLKRLYTIGELAKITGKRTDTLRKYEKSGILAKPSFFVEDEDNSYRNWRFYTEEEVYDAVSFFSGRNPGRPPKKYYNNKELKSSISELKKKVSSI